jgi:uncharacterized protein (TIGR02300 family)
MPARDLGSKFVCFKCNTKFYDMKKPEPVCPKCGTDQRESPANKPAEKTRGRLAAVPKVIEPIAPAAEEPAAESEEDEIEEFADEEPGAAAADEEEP